MDKNMTNDFSVSSKDYCFLCLSKITTKFTSVKRKDTFDNTSPLLTVYSFQDISRYLKIDMKKVFIEGGPIPPNLLAKVERSKLKVELCENCAFMTENISMLCRQLEKLKLEVGSGFEWIHGKISGANQTGRAEQFRRDMGSKLNSGMGDWMEILEVLRMETMQKCYNRIGSTPPRLKIRKLTTKETQKRILRIPEKEAETIKDAELQQNIKIDEPDSTLEDDHRNQGETSFFDDLDDLMDDDDISAVVKDPNEAKTGDVLINTTVKETATGNEPQLKSVKNPDTGKFKCQLCSTEYVTRGNYQKHYNRVHRKLRFKCKICGKEFTSASYFKIHHQNVHLGVRFQCQVCKKIFSQKSILMAHQRKAQCATGMEQKNN